MPPKTAHLAQWQFQPGHKGGPGRPKALITKDDVERLFHILAKSTPNQVESFINNPRTTMIEQAIARAWMNAAASGDVESVLNRSVGKVTENLNIEVPKPSVIHLHDGETIIAGVIEGEVAVKKEDGDENE